MFKRVFSTLAVKLALMIILPGLLVILGLTAFGALEYSKELQSLAEENLKSDLLFAHYYLEGTYAADGWSIKDGEFYLGGQYKIDKNAPVLKELESLISGKVALFKEDSLGETKSSTSSKGASSKQDDPDATSSATQAIHTGELQHEEIVVGEANVTGVPSYVAYMVLDDEVTGEIIGTMAVSMPKSEYTTRVARIGMKLVVVGLIGVFLIALLTFIAVKKAIGVLPKLTVQLDKLAGGDLTIEPIQTKAKDETGRIASAVQNMYTQLREILTSIGGVGKNIGQQSTSLVESSEQTKAATEQIAESVQELLSKLSVQTDETAKADKLVNDIRNDIEGTVEILTNLSAGSQEMLAKSENGGRYVNESVTKMTYIRDVINSDTEVIKALNEEVTEINTVIDAIQGITRQTNLLSLNAAIEAARAGEHGKGFSVVASEIRVLAEQSNRSAQRIEDIVKGILERTKEIVEMTNEKNEAVNSGMKAIQDVGTMFEDLINYTRELNKKTMNAHEYLIEVSKRSVAVAQQLDSVNGYSTRSIADTESIAAASEQQLASIEEIYVIISNLNQTVEGLQEIISNFKM